MAPTDKIWWNFKTLGTKRKFCKCGSRVGSLGGVSTGTLDSRFLDSKRKLEISESVSCKYQIKDIFSLEFRFPVRMSVLHEID